MNTFFASISNREYAIICLVVLFILYCTIKSKDVRKAFFKVLKLLFLSKLTLWFFIPVISLIFVTFLMTKINLWNFSLLKDSIIAIIGCLILFGKSVNSEDFKIVYKEDMMGYFSVVYFFEFFINFYNFNFFIEILLVTFSTIIFLCSMYIDYINDKKQNIEETKNFLNGIQLLLGLFIILHCSVFFFKEPSKLINIHSLQALLLPILYTASFYPICFVLWVYVKYESYLTSIYVVRDNLKKHITNKDLFLKTIKLCGINIRSLKLWQHYFLSSYNCFDNELNIDTMVQEFKYRYTQLDSPQTETEISLYHALNFMSVFNFPISNYMYSNFSDGFGHYQALSYNSENHNVYYCIIGNQQYPQKYLLYDYIQDKKDNKKELQNFLKYCNGLFYNIFSENIDNKYMIKLLKIKNFSFEKGLYIINFIIDRSCIGNSFTITFEINKIKPIELCEYEIKYLKQDKL